MNTRNASIRIVKSFVWLIKRLVLTFQSYFWSSVGSKTDAQTAKTAKFVKFRRWRTVRSKEFDTELWIFKTKMIILYGSFPQWKYCFLSIMILNILAYKMLHTAQIDTTAKIKPWTVGKSYVCSKQLIRIVIIRLYLRYIF